MINLPSINFAAREQFAASSFHVLSASANLSAPNSTHGGAFKAMNNGIVSARQIHVSTNAMNSKHKNVLLFSHFSGVSDRNSFKNFPRHFLRNDVAFSSYIGVSLSKKSLTTQQALSVSSCSRVQICFTCPLYANSRIFYQQRACPHICTTKHIKFVQVF